MSALLQISRWFCQWKNFDKKLSCRSDSSRYDKISDIDRSANTNRNPKYVLYKLYVTNRVVNTWKFVLIVSSDM